MSGRRTGWEPTIAVDQHQLVVLGASAGGVEALTTLAAGLPEDFPAPVAVVLHLPPSGAQRPAGDPRPRRAVGRQRGRRRRAAAARPPLRRARGLSRVVTETADDLTKLLDFLKRARGFDFSGYKRASLERRLRKRMEQVKCETYDAAGRRLKGALRDALSGRYSDGTGPLVIEAISRRGHPIRCAVTAEPLSSRDGQIRGAIMLMEERPAADRS